MEFDRKVLIQLPLISGRIDDRFFLYLTGSYTIDEITKEFCINFKHKKSLYKMISTINTTKLLQTCKEEKFNKNIANCIINCGSNYYYQKNYS